MLAIPITIWTLVLAQALILRWEPHRSRPVVRPAESFYLMAIPTSSPGGSAPSEDAVPSPVAELPTEVPTAVPSEPQPTVTAASAAPVIPLPSPQQDRVVDQLLPEMHRAEDSYGLPRGVLAAIAIWESGGGSQACGYNLWGYAGCAETFTSYTEGIQKSAALLASLPGDLMRRLCTWVAGGGGPSPCSYGQRVIATMAQFQ